MIPQSYFKLIHTKTCKNLAHCRLKCESHPLSRQTHTFLFHLAPLSPDEELTATGMINSNSNSNGHHHLREPYHVPEIVLSSSHKLFRGLKGMTSEYI